jgi:fatty acid/phospholipid biosynthesis enzyme
VVGHGSSTARAITSAIRQAVDCVDARVVERTKGAIEDAR